jgi:SAM-dependent methyltransferase
VSIRPSFAPNWSDYLDRWKAGQSRAVLFRDMVVDEMRGLGRAATVLDIGCGRGFESFPPLQKTVAGEAGRFLGVEPDESIPVGPHFAEVYRCRLEDAPLVPGSVDVAIAVFVLEHLETPTLFWRKLHEVLREGGAFWAVTVDRRHPFCTAARLFERLGLKEPYLNYMRGKPAAQRVETYPVFYRANTPRTIRRQARAFASIEYLSLHRRGQLDYYLPRILRPAAHLLDLCVEAFGLPGPAFVVRLVK